MQQLLLKLQFTKLSHYHLLPVNVLKTHFHQDTRTGILVSIPILSPFFVGVLVCYAWCLPLNVCCSLYPSETLDTALGCGFSVSDDYLQLWHCYCDYMRRRVNDWSEGNLIWVINHACMHQLWGRDGWIFMTKFLFCMFMGSRRNWSP